MVLILFLMGFCEGGCYDELDLGVVDCVDYWVVVLFVVVVLKCVVVCLG